MRESGPKKVRPVPELVKQGSALDDHSIRELLRRSYSESHENILESQTAAHSEEAIFLPPLYGNESKNSALLFNRPNILLFWKLFMQRHIISFEQESLLFMNWHRNEVW
jgi:hypothetical protein